MGQGGRHGQRGLAALREGRRRRQPGQGHAHGGAGGQRRRGLLRRLGDGARRAAPGEGAWRQGHRSRRTRRCRAGAPLTGRGRGGTVHRQGGPDALPGGRRRQGRRGEGAAADGADPHDERGQRPGLGPREAGPDDLEGAGRRKGRVGGAQDPGQLERPEEAERGGGPGGSGRLLPGQAAGLGREARGRGEHLGLPGAVRENVPRG
mmetsp:Transcript_123169/g.359633  ORF Transcript_123169/g.359633 Transcript_123169/m.359633 type:complete len:206 (+) Transcript_123169:1295-1912(+)